MKTKLSDQKLLIEWLKDVHCEELKDRAQETIDLNWLTKDHIGDIGKCVIDDFTDSKLLLQDFPFPDINLREINWLAIGNFLTMYYELKPYEEKEDEALTHELKIEREFFGAIKLGRMKFQVLKNGDYEVGDTLLLKEIDKEHTYYTGNELEVQITYKLPGETFGMKGYIILGIDFND